MPIIKRIRLLIQTYPGLIFLAGLIFLICVVTLKPQFYLIGWDNYSSYFHQPENLFRTIFSTWRSFRGFGVPSDSESVDMFRQLYFNIASLVLPEQVLDQTYYLICLAVGLFSMYAFARIIAKKWFHSKHSVEIASVVAALYYLCNLHTLAVFYFPIITYITRFAFIPLVFLSFHLLLYGTAKQRWILGCCVFVFLLSAGSYVTATIFITMVISLGIWGIFQQQLKKFASILILFFFINAFWIFPFINYTLQKSAIIPLAPTFIDANESQLNKPKSFYDPLKQFLLYPNFFETTVTRLSDSEQVPFHPLAKAIESPFILFMLSSLPWLSAIGAFYLLTRYKTHRKELWIPLLLISYLLLSMKEYSPLGWFYHFMDTTIPFFGVLFRFGDTKFHPYIAFAGSLSLSLFIGTILEWSQSHKVKVLPTKVVLLLFGGLFLLGVLPYVEYFRGNLVAPFMYVRLPNEYREVAQIVNSDTSSGRFLHLPFDRNAYWKSYAWGAMGSSFLHYLIDRPTIDKTFEPASMEHAFLHKRLYTVIADAQMAKETGVWQERVNEFWDILKTSDTRYILLDESVNARIVTRGFSFGGSYPYQDSKVLLDALVEQNQAQIIMDRPIPMNEYLDLYPNRYQLSEEEQSNIFRQTYHVTLYKLEYEIPADRFVSDIKTVDPYYANLLEHEPLTDIPVVYQEEKGIVYPFRRDDHYLTIQDKTANLSIKAQPGEYDLVSSSDISKDELFDVTIQQIGTNVAVNLYWQALPTVNGKGVKTLLSTINFPDIELTSSPSAIVSTKSLTPWKDKNNSRYRLQVGSSMLPVTPTIGSEEQYIGTVYLSTKGDVPVRLWEEGNGIPLKPYEFATTSNPNCFGDGGKAYDVTYDIYDQSVELTTNQGTSCIWRSLDGLIEEDEIYADVVYDVTTSQATTDKDEASFPQTAKPLLREVINSFAPINSVRFCISQEQGGDCLNRHVFLSLDHGRELVRVSMERPIPSGQGLITLLALRTIGYQAQRMNVSSLTFVPFRPLAEDQVRLTFPAISPVQVRVSEDQTVSVDVPISVSQYSYIASLPDENFYVTNKPCEDMFSYRTFRRTDKLFISSVENCYNSFFADLPYSSETIFLWGIGYQLYTGKYPQFIVKDKITTPYSSYVSLYQGYPNVAGFKQFQTPEWKTVNRQKVESAFSEVQTTSASVILPPQKGTVDFRTKEFTVTHHSEGEGVIGLDAFAVLPMPSRWRDLSLDPVEGSIKRYQVPEFVKMKTILPSLYQVTFRSPEAGPWLFRFDQGYDDQWKVLSSSVVSTSHGRCDGYANCFVLQTRSEETGEREHRMLIFYTPEILSFLGWMVTGVTVLVVLSLTIFRRSMEAMMRLIKR